MRIIKKNVMFTIAFGIMLIYTIIEFVLKMNSLSRMAEQNEVVASIFGFVVQTATVVAAYGLCCSLAFLRKPHSLEKRFLSAAFLFGFLYVVVLSPFSVPDEPAHYLTSYQISNYLTMEENPSQINAEDEAFVQQCVPHQNDRESLIRGITGLRHVKENSNKKVDSDMLNNIRTLVYYVEYLPQALGIAFAKIFRLGYSWKFYIGRTFNLAFYLLCFYAALRIIPHHKILLGIIGILPMSLQQAASFSYDGFINGMSFLLTALLLRAAASREKMTLKEYLSILIVGILLTPAKGVYAGLMLMFLLIPSERFSRRYQKGIGFFAMLLLCGMFFLTTIPSMQRVLNSPLPQQGSQPWTLSYMIAHPLRMISLSVKTLILLSTEWLYEAIGSKMSGLTLMLPGWIPLGFIFILLLSAQSMQGEEIAVSIREKLIFCVCIGIVIVGFFITMLLTWNSLYTPYISGIQGRYFLPVLTQIFLCANLKSVKIKDDIRSKLLKAAILLSACTLYYIVWYTM